MTGPDERPRTSDERRPVLHVGLGATARDDASLRAFAGALQPGLGAAFVLVQPRSPDGIAIDAARLGAATTVNVRTATDGTRPERDTLYLAAPGELVRLLDDVLRVEPSDAGEHPVDTLLLSLADGAGPRSAGVVLHGIAPDGERGLRAIKAAGGLVLVQDPATADSDGADPMSWSVGAADFTLDPPGLAARLESYARHPLVSGTAGHVTHGLESDDGSLARIFELLREHGRIDFSHYKSSTVAQRIERRMEIHRTSDLGGYLTLLESDEREVRTLGRELLIQSTRFFRDPDAFARLDASVVRPLVEGDGHEGELRAWVAGCATGEEAWSLAILFDEAQSRTGKRRRVKIFATDVDPGALAAASRARYSGDTLADLSPERLARHFVRDGDAFVPDAALRQRVVFSAHDLVVDPPFSQLDLVCCRNVLAQFQQPVQQRVVASFHFALRRGGSLFLGATEGIGELDSHFESLDGGRGTYRKLGNDRVPLSTSRRVQAASDPGRPAGLPPVTDLLRGYRSTPRDQRYEHVKDALIHDHVPPCIVLDAARRPVHVYGDAGKYLARFPTGRTATEVHELVTDELAAAVSAGLERAARDGRSMRYDDILVASVAGAAGDGARPVLLDLQVEHHPERNGRPAWFVVLFHERGRTHGIAPSRSVAEEHGTRRARSVRDDDADARTRARIADLEAELLRSRERYGNASEEFETVHEGLLVANDALATSNEALRSANAALRASNAELAARVEGYRRESGTVAPAGADDPE